MALVERDSRHNYCYKKGLRRYEPRSRFPHKPPFRPLFGAFYPHPAHKSALRAEGPPGLWHPGNLVGPPCPPGHYSPTPRPTPHTPPAGSGRARTLPRWLLPDTDRRFVKDRKEPDLEERPLYIQYVTEPGDSRGKINPFLPTRLRPTVKHSLAAGDAQRQWLQARLPDDHTAQCLFSPWF